MMAATAKKTFLGRYDVYSPRWGHKDTYTVTMTRERDDRHS